MSRWNSEFRAKRQPDGRWHLDATKGECQGTWDNIPTLEDAQRTVREYGANEIEWTYFNDDGSIREVKTEKI